MQAWTGRRHCIILRMTSDLCLFSFQMYIQEKRKGNKLYDDKISGEFGSFFKEENIFMITFSFMWTLRKEYFCTDFGNLKKPAKIIFRWKKGAFLSLTRLSEDLLQSWNITWCNGAIMCFIVLLFQIDDMGNCQRRTEEGSKYGVAKFVNKSLLRCCFTKTNFTEKRPRRMFFHAMFYLPVFFLCLLQKHVYCMHKKEVIICFVSHCCNVARDVWFTCFFPIKYRWHVCLKKGIPVRWYDVDLSP